MIFYKCIYLDTNVLVIAAQPLYIFSSAFANQSTLGVVGPFSLIASLLFARLLLNEKIS